jgi:hypothetical protein
MVSIPYGCRSHYGVEKDPSPRRGRRADMGIVVSAAG